MHVHGVDSMQSWAGSLERFLAEFCHGRGFGVLHPNLNGKVSFARQVSSEESSPQQAAHKSQNGRTPSPTPAPTPTPPLRGGEEEKQPEKVVKSHKDALLAVVSRRPFYHVNMLRIRLEIIFKGVGLTLGPAFSYLQLVRISVNIPLL